MSVINNYICGECGISFWLEKSDYIRRGLNGKTVFCPNGHEQIISREEAEAKQRNIEAQTLEYEKRVDARNKETLQHKFRWPWQKKSEAAHE